MNSAFFLILYLPNCEAFCKLTYCFTESEPNLNKKDLAELPKGYFSLLSTTPQSPAEPWALLRLQVHHKPRHLLPEVGGYPLHIWEFFLCKRICLRRPCRSRD